MPVILFKILTVASLVGALVLVPWILVLGHQVRKQLKDKEQQVGETVAEILQARVTPPAGYVLVRRELLQSIVHAVEELREDEEEGLHKEEDIYLKDNSKGAPGNVLSLPESYLEREYLA